MVAYSFKRQFIEPIQTGRKRQTMRNERARHARAGEAIQLYTAMRTKQCRLIGRATCENVMPVRLDFVRSRVELPHGVFDRQVELDTFARSDGFDDWRALAAFWKNENGATTQWSGVVITWCGLVLP